MNVPRPTAAVTIVVFLALLVLNVALVLQNRRLKAEIAAPPAMLPQIGTKINLLEGVAPDGSKIQVRLTEDDKDTLLFVFSTNCAICNLNWPAWQAVARSLQAKPFRLIYANIDSQFDGSYARQYGIEHATVFAHLDPRYQAALNLRLTPLTILLTGEGEVVHVWPGLLQADQISDLDRTLGLVATR